MFRIHFTRFLQSLIEIAEKNLDIEDVWEQMASLSRYGVTKQEEEQEAKAERPEKLEGLKFSEKLDITDKLQKLDTRKKPAVEESEDDVLAAAKAKAASLFETTEL